MPSKVLIVDDEPNIVEILGRLLAQQGYEIRTAASAEEALALLDHEPVNAILLDNNLPGMTGMRALAEIRRRTAAPTLLMTGHFDEGFATDALLLGAAGILSKPFDFTKVEALLARLIAKA